MAIMAVAMTASMTTCFTGLAVLILKVLLYAHAVHEYGTSAALPGALQVTADLALLWGHVLVQVHYAGGDKS